MNGKKENHTSKPAQMTVMLRLIAGGYLAYLAFGLLKEYVKPGSGGQLIQIVCGVLFLAVGAVLAVWALRKLIKGDYVKFGELPEDDGGDNQAS